MVAEGTAGSDVEVLAGVLLHVVDGADGAELPIIGLGLRLARLFW